MPKYDIFHLIAGLRDKEHICCILIGGFAVNFHKYSRHTMDVDFLITKEDFQKIRGPLESAGYKSYRDNENFVQLKDGQGIHMDIDFMFVDQETVLGIKEEGKTVKFVGEEFTVPSLQHLIALKLHAMKCNKGRLTIDLVDIINLIKLNEVDFKSKDFEALCLKFGTQEIYNKIKEALI